MQAGLPPPFPLPPEAAPAADPRSAPTATRPAPPAAAARCSTAAGGPGYISRHVVAAPPPRPGTCPWKITASPPAPAPGRAVPVPATPSGCSGGRSRSARLASALPRYRTAAPGEQQMRDRPASRFRRRPVGGAPPGAITGVVSGVAPGGPVPTAPEPLAAPVPSPVAHSLPAPVLPRLPARPGTRCWRRCEPLTVPMPPPRPSRRAGWARKGTAPPCPARCRYRCRCRARPGSAAAGAAELMKVWRSVGAGTASRPRRRAPPPAPPRSPAPRSGTRTRTGVSGTAGHRGDSQRERAQPVHAMHTRGHTAHRAHMGTLHTRVCTGTCGRTRAHPPLGRLGHTHDILGTHGHLQPTGMRTPRGTFRLAQAYSTCEHIRDIRSHTCLFKAHMQSHTHVLTHTGTPHTACIHTDSDHQGTASRQTHAGVCLQAPAGMSEVSVTVVRMCACVWLLHMSGSMRMQLYTHACAHCSKCATSTHPCSPGQMFPVMHDGCTGGCPLPGPLPRPPLSLLLPLPALLSLLSPPFPSLPHPFSCLHPITLPCPLHPSQLPGHVVHCGLGVAVRCSGTAQHPKCTNSTTLPTSRWVLSGPDHLCIPTSHARADLMEL